MTIEKNKQVFIQFNKELFGAGNIAITKELLSDSFINHTPPPNAPGDASPMIKFASEFHKGFSDVDLEIHEVVAEGDKVALRKTISGTSTGEFFGNKPSGKKITLTSIEFAVIKDGKITDYWAKNNYPLAVRGLWQEIAFKENPPGGEREVKTESSGTLEKNKQVVSTFSTEFFEKANTAVAGEFLAAGFVNHTAPPNVPTDASGMIQFITAFHNGFSNINVQIDEIIAEGDKVSVRKIITATQTGEFMGKAPTGKTVTIHAIEIDVLKNGKITDHWNGNDLMQVLQGL